MAEIKERLKLPVAVTKPTPYTFDLGLLLTNDPNPLQRTGNLEDDLSSTARDGAQALLNQLLSTCPISSTPAGVLLSLPATSTQLPREKVTIFLLRFSLLSPHTLQTDHVVNDRHSPYRPPKPKLPGPNSRAKRASNPRVKTPPRGRK